MEQSNNEQNQPAFSFTNHLTRAKKAEMDLLHQFRFQFPELRPGVTEVARTSSIAVEDKKKTMMACEGDSAKVVLRKNCRIDDRAFVVNGRLVYLRQGGEGVAGDSRQLLQQLKANNIGLRDYVLGRKENYHRQIAENHMRREEEIIGGYIRKHINVEKTAKVEFADSFESTKQELFCGK